MATGIDRETAWRLMTENVAAQGLRRHMLAVEAAVRWYAGKLGHDAPTADTWAMAGLLHDWDWEIHPTLETHPAAGLPILQEKGVDPEILQAIAAHNTEGTGVERKTPLDFALLACDEVTGLIIAAALVRPSKDVREVEVKSIKKRWKERAFAAGVDREHVGNVLIAMQGVAAELDLDGRLAAPAS